MKLVLASQGFTTPEIAAAVAKLAGKPLDSLDIAVINEAYTEIEPGRHEGWLVEELSLITHYAKGVVSFVNLRAYDIEKVRQRLAFANVIYIVGGAQIILPRLFRETGFDKLLRELAEQKIIMGTSAGANVLGRQIEDPTYWEDQYGSSADYLVHPSLGLVDFNILPHFERTDHPRRNAKILSPLLQNTPFALYGLSDEQAIIFDNGKMRFVGGNPPVFGKPE